MNCGMKDEMLLAWVDGDLDQTGRARVSEHIVGCLDCHRTIGELKQVTGALEKWAVADPVSLPTSRELLDRAGLPPSTAPGSGGWRNFARKYGAVAGIVLFAAVAGLVVLPRYTSNDRSGLATAPMESGASSKTSTGRGGEPPDERPGTDSAKPEPPRPGADAQPEAGSSADQDASGKAERADAVPVQGGVEVPPSDGPAPVSASEEAPKPDPAPAPGAVAQPSESVARRDEDDGRGADKAGSGAAATSPAPPASKSAARSADRRASTSAVVRRADIAIAGGEAAAIADRVAAAARAENGTVTKRWARSNEDGAQTVTIELNVPAGNFEQTISRLRGVGNVQSVRRSAIDLSGRIAEIDGELGYAGEREDGVSASRKQKESKDSLQRERQSLAARAERAFITVTIVQAPER